MLDEAALDSAEEQWLIIQAFDLGSGLTEIAEGKGPLLEAREPRGARCRCQDAQTSRRSMLCPASSVHPWTTTTSNSSLSGRFPKADGRVVDQPSCPETNAEHKSKRDIEKCHATGSPHVASDPAHQHWYHRTPNDSGAQDARESAVVLRNRVEQQ